MNEGSDFEAWEVDIHGHRAVYRAVGDGPPVVLIHGMINSSRHWRDVAVRLAESGYTAIAPDLIGHGDSATPRGDYSIGAHAAAIRDLLVAIGVRRASVVGHSLGGGIAMQFFWQFPERVERIALISSGGLGPDVAPMLRGAAIPGIQAAVRAAAHPAALGALDGAASALDRRGWRNAVYLRAVVRALRPLEDAGGRRAFLQTLRSVIDVHGQKVSATDRLYLLGPVPTLILWGERDHTIPQAHGLAAHREIPGSRFETLPRAAHFPHLEDPAGVADALARFLGETQPCSLDDDAWEALLATRSVRRRLRAVA